MKYPDDFVNKVINGDCIEVMKNIPDNCIDTIITDPPYGLSFMGKEWDSFGTDLQKYQEWTRQWAVEALRVAKPGATLLCFGGTRTWHRLACGLEDAGWIIKDTIMWIYGQGFPKSLNIALQFEQELCERKDNKWVYRDTGEEMRRKPPFRNEQANLWIGYGTALKPAFEPIIWAIKPNDKNFVNNALKWGVAGLNIDGGRIEIDKEKETDNRVGTDRIRGDRKGLNSTSIFGQSKKGVQMYKEQGRFPANLILTEECFTYKIKEGISPEKIKKIKGWLYENT